ncbi:MAG TPA: UDP-N-acetylmuramoyl-L-alanyl-D-glutamate--2,6-diaminopimelate ligase [Leptospiraceae bacterium]|nr:UDP-N-acetylmuramoyl-L-alanyl-D-glutamate--2,6-diaminopimelate ligase [Leptospiraceae bacterium]HMX34368.1 UDP-N-acetylmuramoyl-L-alanyl-D-glutamate--2,6-diaminopimelate ligase [Leptospiraceae bacterium]HMY30315.1 UDP-N-acetylmuramoyl-L-alanyl-D-glutamate--2,6-diaminopimelate ligase [Leptospiraceae bacterium]HMZ63668.1 UDP-N-acetylmuramoyl-L-alanyl-D-glutamate--2,6-diaminopimelate ligase [Leptospiraceae bacterium]HNA08511.1 UDP-N-acetylmuramoyl-L-alanyl-D-glutamate--2,6-diaminopimelate ligas
MLISELLKNFKKISLTSGNLSEPINYIQSDSRKLEENDIFCVYDDFSDKTIDYLKDAKSKNIKTILIRKTSPYLDETEQFPNVLICSEDPMQLHGYIASFLKDDPSKKCKIIAVTGTNGKTSMTYILYDIFSRENKNCGIIGTIETKYGNKVIQTGYTTPDASTLNSVLADMVKEEIEYVFMEASSHGLKLGRLNGLHIYGALFTNLTRDHLDFHKTMNDYLKSKFLLFKLLSKSCHENTFAAMSVDSSGSDKMLSLIKKAKLKINLLLLGKGKQFETKLNELSLKGIDFDFKEKGNQQVNFTTNLLGNFNFLNVSLAIVASRALGLETESIRNTVGNLIPVNGRFQIVYNSKKTRVAIVDYAHTPDALQNVLKSMQEIPHSKIICLFGCGGDRDKTKRPIMGSIAAKLADLVIITSDNPRSEDPELILDEIQAGFPKKFKSFLRITNRRQAIKKGIEILPDDGLLLVAGKGHETVQIIGTKREDFSDARELIEAFSQDEISRR